jgi:hypothetical protein
MKKIMAVLMAVVFAGTAQMVLAKGTGGGKGAHALSPKKRLGIQHKRIKDGIKNGTITKDEAKQLHQEGKEINQERKADLAKDGGKLNKEDRKDLEGKLDQRSKEIYNDKHPAGSTGGTTGGTSTGSTTNGQ